MNYLFTTGVAGPGAGGAGTDQTPIIPGTMQLLLRNWSYPTAQPAGVAIANGLAGSSQRISIPLDTHKLVYTNSATNTAGVLPVTTQYQGFAANGKVYVKISDVRVSASLNGTIQSRPAEGGVTLGALKPIKVAYKVVRVKRDAFNAGADNSKNGFISDVMIFPFETIPSCGRFVTDIYEQPADLFVHDTQFLNWGNGTAVTACVFPKMMRSKKRELEPGDRVFFVGESSERLSMVMHCSLHLVSLKKC